MSQNLDDRSVNNLLREIDDLINRMGDKNESHKSDNSFKEQLKQTGRFQVENDLPEFCNEIPKKFNTSIPKKFSSSIPKKQEQHSQKKVTIQANDSSSSSSSSEDEYQVNKKKNQKMVTQPKCSPNKQKWGGSQCSYRSKVMSHLRCESQSQLSQAKIQYVQPIKDVFCLNCEEFIPIDIVNFHMTECQSNDQKMEQEAQQLRIKLENYKKLLGLRFEACLDETVKDLIELLHNCTQQLIDVTDQYQLSQTIEDLTVIKTQLNQNTKAYHVLTVASKIQEIANRKMQHLVYEQTKFIVPKESIVPKEQIIPKEPIVTKEQIIPKEPSQLHQNRAFFMQQEQQNDRQTVISYATNTTTRKRLFEQPSLQNLPKQLIKLQKPIPNNQNKQNNEDEISNQVKGIEFGNNFDSSKKREYIQLSNSKNKTKQHTTTSNKEEIRESEPTVISKIQTYISNVKDKFSNENEQRKKKFFLRACKIKDKFPVNHPAQNVLISEMFNQCQRQQIPEEEWEVWINNIFQNA